MRYLVLALVLVLATANSAEASILSKTKQVLLAPLKVAKALVVGVGCGVVVGLYQVMWDWDSDDE